ncbi:2-nonaprenyl-3-methyl-6-methoxy-1,4-benzoquinol hydroxylase [Actinidia chinensis var. chinensis]|uniref:2-nonaprenyl-3-methyl-6-methoxy-1,4-benzoquinol hydroxylase n=1 Tax=Actinidia chinensis var. chinensis TaxID=1590841 RepID=A0A2R6S1E7_ACTCC|nr:2-nonaprenyl-3-methyl-6-methoxy-1,4-benzoquinol hydroxylase [Actinidia chinensis var. chinensis]
MLIEVMCAGYVHRLTGELGWAGQPVPASCPLLYGLVKSPHWCATSRGLVLFELGPLVAEIAKPRGGGARSFRRARLTLFPNAKPRWAKLEHGVESSSGELLGRLQTSWRTSPFTASFFLIRLLSPVGLGSQRCASKGELRHTFNSDEFNAKFNENVLLA